jgi:hypothetical protein
MSLFSKQQIYNPSKLYHSGGFAVAYHPTRFCLVKLHCPYCLRALRAVNLVNRHLPDDKKIRIIDNYEWEQFGYKSYAIMDKLDPKTFEGYPFTLIDGINIEPGETEHMAIAIAKLVEEDLIFPINMEDILILG